MQLFPPMLDVSDNEGFGERDLFKRAAFGAGLANLVASVNEPMVIALDGPWGSGKSTFLKMWAGHLRNDGFPVVYFDAFENDYIDDAFSAIAGEIIALVDQKKRRNTPQSRKFVRNAINASKVIARSAIKVGITAATHGVVDGKVTDKVEEIISSEISALTDKYVGEAITKQAERRGKIEAFRLALKELPSALGSTSPKTLTTKPLIFIIDELDRCKPVFSLEVLERIKHFFSVPNVHFILGTDLIQLDNSVKSAYGSDINSRTYLQKFIQLSISLPDIVDVDDTKAGKAYAKWLTSKLKFETDDQRYVGNCVDFIQRCASGTNITLRDIERIMTNIALTIAFTPANMCGPFPLIAGLCIIRVISPANYQLIKTQKLNYKSAEALLGLNTGSRGRDNFTKEAVEVWRYCLDTVDKEITDRHDQGLFKFSLNSRIELLPHLATNVVDKIARS